LKKAILYIHGKGGSYTEAELYQKSCKGFDIVGVDYNDYLPWIVKKEIEAAYSEISKRYDKIYILANSIGAYFAMNALQNYCIEKALFISPILNMEKVILTMMNWANVSEIELQKQKEIPTKFGETLSWEFLCYVRNNPLKWNVPTKILYAENDNLTDIQTVNNFVNTHNASFTIMKNGEHWFHTCEQLLFLNEWLKKQCESI
jgi:hypothetical protein